MLTVLSFACWPFVYLLWRIYFLVRFVLLTCSSLYILDFHPLSDKVYKYFPLFHRRMCSLHSLKFLCGQPLFLRKRSLPWEPAAHFLSEGPQAGTHTGQGWWAKETEGLFRATFSLKQPSCHCSTEQHWHLPKWGPQLCWVLFFKEKSFSQWKGLLLC